MKLYMKQKFLTFGTFDIFDENKNAIFFVECPFAFFNRKLTVYDTQTNQQVAFIHQRHGLFTCAYDVDVYGQFFATIQQKLSFWRTNFDIDELGWTIKGSVWDHDFTIYDDNDNVIAVIRKEYFTWSDTFEVDIVNDEDVLYVIATVLAIDACLDHKNNS